MQSRFMEATGLVLEQIEESRVSGHLDLDAAHYTPWGIVHGGVYAAAIETAASTGASHAVAGRGMFAVGLTNTTQFLRSTEGGRVTLEATTLHQGRTQQLWRVELRDERARLLAHGELRLQNLPDPAAADAEAIGAGSPSLDASDANR